MAFDDSSLTAAQRQRRALGRAVLLLGGARDFHDALRQTLAACLPTVGDFGFFDMVVRPGEVRRTVAAHDAPDIEALLAPTQWVRQEHPELNLCALSSASAALHPDTTDAWYRRIAANEGHLGLLRQLAFRSMITVPLRYRDELVGALTLFMGRSGRRHTEDDLAFAVELAALAAPVVANARLLEEHRAARAEAESARERLEVLAAAGTVLAHSLDTEQTLQAIASVIVPRIADWCRIDLIDDQGVLQRRLAHHTDPVRSQDGLELAKKLRAAPGTVGSMAWCIANGRSHYGRFDEAPSRDDPALRQFTQTFGLRAHLILPLVARGRTIGAMGVLQAESGRDVSPEDRALIQDLGQRAALALDNAHAYAEAEAARRQAEAASRAKDEFLAMLGHELRNPLAPIATALELMSRRDPNSHIEERRIVGRQVAHLSRLIDDLLDVSRITQGKVELRREPVDLRLVAAHAVEQTQSLFQRRAKPVELHLPRESAYVDGDVVRLTQVICNLLVNSAKYTPEDGRISLTLRVDGGGLVVEVEDTGRGISPELLPQVFDLFVQGRQSIDRQAGGMGLGLSIVKMLVEMHGGSVSAWSEGEGRGSRFTVRLPTGTMAPRAGGEAPLALGRDMPGRRILVVDDNTDAAETLGELLRVVGCEVRCACDGESALAVLDHWRPDLALMDIGLPGLDGYQLAARFRADPRVADIRLVALTGYGRDNDRARAMEARFDEHLVKPVPAERLFEVIEKQLAR